MVQRIEDYLSPPIQHNANKRRIARIVQSIAVALLIAFAVNLPITLANHNWSATMALLIGTPPIMVALWLSRRGYVSTAVFMMAVILLLIITLIATLTQGINDVTVLAYPGILVVSSLVLNRRVFMMLVGLTIAAVGWLALGAMFGLFVPVLQPTSFLTDLVAILSILIITTLSVYSLVDSMQQAVNERQLTEQALRESQSMLQLIFDHAFDGISVYEEFPEQGGRRLIDCNTRYAEMAGRSKEELLAIGNTLSIQQSVDGPRDRAEFVERLDQGVYVGRFSWVRPDGQENVIEYAAVPRHVDDRLLVIGVDHDITAQLQTEAALERERTLLRTLVDSMPAVIFAKDIDGRKILANTGDQYSMGVHSEAEVLGKTDFEIYPPEKAARFMEEDRRVLEQGETLESETSYVDGLTGVRRWLSGSKRPLRNQAGQIIGLIGSFYDITRIKQGEIEREKLIAELEAKNAELERFTYTVSHDLKSPLITIGGFIGFLQKDLLDGNVTQAQEDMARINAALAKMQQLLDELLELSRIGRRMNPPETVPFEAIAQEAVELVRGRITAGNVTVEIMPDLPTVHGDRARLVEVVQNLVDNACKYMGDTAQPHIEIGALQDNGEAVFYVRDNGIGIDPHYHEKVFGLFDKLDPASDGAGVGLAIAKRIVETHGGKIWVESEGAGCGSTFWFTLNAAI